MKNLTKGAPRSKTDLVSVLLTGILLLLPAFSAELHLSYAFATLGRLHPIIVHFPIVFIPLTLILEWMFGNFRGPIGISILRFLYNCSLYSAIAAVIVGYLLYLTGDYGGDLVKWHMWSAVGVAILMIWSINLKKSYARTHRWRWKQASKALLILATALIIYTGHQGGSLTHGPEFLTEPITSALKQKRLDGTQVRRAPESLLIFDDILLPAFEQKCLKCHNDQNAKSDLDLSTVEAIHAGGKSLKPMIVAGEPQESELLHRVILPPKHDDFMPPDGKPPLDPTEVLILEAWIQNGASAEDSLGSYLADDTLKPLLDEYLPKLAQAQISKEDQRMERLKTGPKLIKIGSSLGLEIRPDPETDSALYTVSMLLPPKVITDETIAKLMPYKDYFSTLSLVSADITDEGLFYIGQMTNLRELILAKSCIKGPGLDLLKNLKNLETINLSHTDVNDENLLFLTKLPALKRAYVFNTFASQAFIETLDQHLKQAKITFEEGSFY